MGKHVYFVGYQFNVGNSGFAFGNVRLETSRPVATIEDIRNMEKVINTQLEEKYGKINSVILNFQKLKK